MNDIVLIVTDNVKTAKTVADRLGHDGYKTMIAEFDGQRLHDTPLDPPLAVLLHFTDFVEAVPQITQVLKDRYHVQNIPFIGAFSRPSTINLEELDSVLLQPAHPVQIAHRLKSIIRLSTMQAEIALRQKTLHEEFGISHHLPNQMADKPLRILFVGQAKPEFLVLINALQKQNVDVIAAFTSFSAFEFLHETAFDAVIVSALDSSELALLLIQTMRRNSRLYHVPVVLLTPKIFDDQKLAYEKGAADLIDAELPEAEIRGRIIELGKFHRLQNALRQEFSSMAHKACHDVSGTYNLRFFRAHLERQCAYQAALSKKVSVLVVDFAVKPDIHILPERLSIARSEAGSILKNIVRMQDVTARLLPGRYAIALPGQIPAELENMENRIKLTFLASAFDTGLIETTSFVFDVKTKFYELNPDENNLDQNMDAWFYHLMNDDRPAHSAPSNHKLNYSA